MNTDRNFKFSWKSAIVGMYIMAMLLTFFTAADDVDGSVTKPTPVVQEADVPDAAICYAHAWKHKWGVVAWQSCGP